MSKRIGTVAVLLLSWCSAARSDLVPFGQRYVENERFIDNLADYPDYVFYVANDRKLEEFGKNHLVGRGPSSTPWYELDPDGKVGRTYFSRVQTTAYLFAVPRRLALKGTPQASWFSQPEPGILKSAVPVGDFGYWASTSDNVFTADRTAKIVTHYRVELTDSALQLNQVSSVRLNAPGNSAAQVFAAAFGAIAVAAIGVIYSRSRRTRSTAAKPLPDATAPSHA